MAGEWVCETPRVSSLVSPFPLFAAISGYEVPIVALAVVALTVIIGSALVGTVTRLSRGRVGRTGRRRRSPD